MSPSEHVDITVRPAVESDIADLSDAMAGDVSREQLVNRWREHVAGYRVMLVALLDGNVAGTVSIGGHNHQRPDSLRLFALDVASALRRRGAGSALVCAVEHEAGLRGLGHLNLEVAQSKTDEPCGSTRGLGTGGLGSPSSTAGSVTRRARDGSRWRDRPG